LVQADQPADSLTGSTYILSPECEEWE
jgi:hypothetical protein